MRAEIKRGDIFYIVPYYAVGSEQYAGRPAIIVSNDINNKLCDTFEVVFLTTKEKPPLPTHAKILSAPRESIALCEQINTVAKERIGDYCGSVTESEMNAVDEALAKSISLACKHIDATACDELKEKATAAEKKYNKLKLMYDDLLRRFIEGEAG